MLVPFEIDLHRSAARPFESCADPPATTPAAFMNSTRSRRAPEKNPKEPQTASLHRRPSERTRVASTTHPVEADGCGQGGAPWMRHAPRQQTVVRPEYRAFGAACALGLRAITPLEGLEAAVCLSLPRSAAPIRETVAPGSREADPISERQKTAIRLLVRAGPVRQRYALISKAVRLEVSSCRDKSRGSPV